MKNQRQAHAARFRSHCAPEIEAKLNGFPLATTIQLLRHATKSLANQYAARKYAKETEDLRQTIYQFDLYLRDYLPLDSYRALSNELEAVKEAGIKAGGL